MFMEGDSSRRAEKLIEVFQEGLQDGQLYALWCLSNILKSLSGNISEAISEVFEGIRKRFSNR